MKLEWIYALIFAFLVTSLFAPRLIPVLARLKFGQNVRDDGPSSHLKKQGTPTMGGLIFLLGVLIVGIMFGLRDGQIFLTLALMLLFGAIGFIDDFLKIKKKQSEGLTALQKLILQLIVALIYLVVKTYLWQGDTDIRIPFMQDNTLELGVFFVPIMVIVILGTVNGVNLTDGLDGLASSVTAIVCLFFMLASNVLDGNIAFLPAIVFGSLLAFLLYNVYPAKVFMGDTGSLALGGFVAGMAIDMKLPIFILLFGIIYFLESVSVIIQVGYYKRTKKRFFKMAPLHHHFELSGASETRVVMYFTVITIIMSLIAILALI